MSLNDHMNVKFMSDKLAISLSLICVAHCFFVPSFLILSSGFISLSLDNEMVHKLILILAVPISLFALISGHSNHKNYTIFLNGAAGLTLLVLAAVLGESFLGEFGEKTLTLVGSLIVATSHYKNYKICKNIDCECHDIKSIN